MRYTLMLAILAFSAALNAQPPKKIVMVIFENTDFKLVMNEPFFAKFAASGTLLTNFHAMARPSQPNYIALVAGSVLGVKSNSIVDLSETHIGDLIEAKGKNWRVYAEGYPGNCFLGKKMGK